MFVVISSLYEDHPQVLDVQAFKDKGPALDQAVRLALEQGATDDEETVHQELEDDGVYVPDKYSPWSVSFAEVEPE